VPHLVEQAEPDFVDWTSSMIKGTAAELELKGCDTTQLRYRVLTVNIHK
jgi:hypothetical protein